MEELLRFLRAYEVWVYVILGVGGLLYLRKFGLAWQELRGRLSEWSAPVRRHA